MKKVTVIFIDNTAECLEDQRDTFVTILKNIESYSRAMQSAGEDGIVPKQFSFKKGSEANEMIIELEDVVILMKGSIEEINLKQLKMKNVDPYNIELDAEGKAKIDELSIKYKAINNELLKESDSHVLFAVDICMDNNNNKPAGIYLAKEIKNWGNVILYSGQIDNIRETSRFEIPIYHRAVQGDNQMNERAASIGEVSLTSRIDEIKESLKPLIMLLLSNDFANVNFLGEVLFESLLLVNGG